jgi:hypothetical protein
MHSRSNRAHGGLRSKVKVSRADDPDLIAAYGTHGQFGYVLATDLYQPISPGLHVGEVGHARSIALFAKDGITTIAVYRTERGGSGPGTAERP